MARKSQRNTDSKDMKKPDRKGAPPKRPKNFKPEGDIIQDEDVEVLLADDNLVDTITPEDNIKLKEDEILKIWEENMHDFVPEDHTTFIVKGSHASTVYEDIGHTKPT
jgi:hypothetical protein